MRIARRRGRESLPKNGIEHLPLHRAGKIFADAAPAPEYFLKFHILMVFASFLRVNRSIKFISFDDGEHAGHDFST